MTDNTQDIRETARLDALALLDTAKETARQMLLQAGMDSKKISLICIDIVRIKISQEAGEKRLEAIEGNLTWAVRVVVGAVILALIYVVIPK